ncbi:MAG TPA: sigma-70 family RNA polymerase sigma factor [Verrucomicrobiae bacterium]|jgi:RNA polymerase sigma factor (sigma-70 family)
MSDPTDNELLARFVQHDSEIAFAALVERHLALVHSVALRHTTNPELAQDIAQAVFIILARKAAALNPKIILPGWLYNTARLTAANWQRAEIRRVHREQEVFMQSTLADTTSDELWRELSPLLDEAMGKLGEHDRDAIVLRYFQNQSLSQVGAALGLEERAAQKRVMRAVEKLRKFFLKRGLTPAAVAMLGSVSANSVQAAPPGLAAIISAGALSKTIPTTAALVAATKTITMTTIQKTLITTALVAAVGAGIFEAQQAAQLRSQYQKLQQQQAPFAEQIRQLKKERDDATNRLAGMAEEIAKINNRPAEVLKLRGEVGTLRQEKKNIGEKSALNKITADPATRKIMRDQQKMGLSTIYSDLAKRLNLTPEMADKFNDLLADNIMDGIDLTTQALHDGKSQAEVDQIFSSADAALKDKIQALLGDDGLAQYKDYSQNLISTLSAQQFAGKLTGDAAEKADKQNQLQQAIQAATAAALQNAGLPPDYQVVPMLNLANIASEAQATQSLNLLDTIYANVAASSSSFLSPEELASFKTFRETALSNNRTILSMNRNLMAPIAQ